MKKLSVIATVLFMAVLFGCARREEIDQNNHGPVMVLAVEPVYPVEAKTKKVEGDVWVKMWVNERGRVTKAMIENTPDQVLVNAALDAAMKTRFTPAVIDGKQVGVWLILPFSVKNK
ncbi:MAG: energy transducer TonB [Bacteriovoracaceae bacterium]|nr:energy transducer TonB [Bacteroidota bacterium]